MKDFPKGVSYYTKGMVEISFPENDICCFRCPLLASEYKPNREYCKLTGEYILASQHMVGERCPIKIRGDKQE